MMSRQVYWRRLGPDYHSFLRAHLPPWIVPPVDSGFNFSSCQMSPNAYMCSVRFRIAIPILFGQKIIPGNHKRGKNFSWNRWNDPKFVDSTCFFVSQWTKHNILIIDENIRPTFLWSQPVCKPKGCALGAMPLLSDIRLFADTTSNNTYFIDGNVTTIRQVHITDGRINLTTGYYLRCLCPQSLEYCFDKNWSFVDVDRYPDGDAFLFLNWIRQGYVILTSVDLVGGQCRSRKCIRLGGDHIIDGLGTSISPMFSFGTPCLKLSKNCFIGVGHAKIILTANYQPESNIHKFRDRIRKTLGANSKYVEHQSYIYCIYFFVYQRHSDPSKETLLISDCFLPICSSEDYIFSIFFPMSIFQINSKMVVTGGSGDFYSVALDFTPSWVRKQLKHDISDFHINNYDYHVIDCVAKPASRGSRELDQ